MNAYEKLVKAIRNKQESQIRIGEYRNGKIVIGDLILDEDDYLIAEHLKTGYQKTEEERVGALKNGDTILLIKINEEIYAAVERMVEP